MLQVMFISLAIIRKSASNPMKTRFSLMKNGESPCSNGSVKGGSSFLLMIPLKNGSKIKATSIVYCEVAALGAPGRALGLSDE